MVLGLRSFKPMTREVNVKRPWTVVSPYTDRVARASQFREPYEQIWRRILERVAGKAEIEDRISDYDGDIVKINLPLSIINVVYPAVSKNRPKLIINPQHPDRLRDAESATLLVNDWWKRYEAHPHFRLMTKTALEIGHGWMKTTWLQGPDQTGPDKRETFGQLQGLRDQYADPDRGIHGPTDDQILAFMAEAEAGRELHQPQVSRPAFMYVNPFDMYIDPESTSIIDARWVCQRIWLDAKRVAENPAYDQTTRQRAAETAGSMSDMSDSGRIGPRRGRRSDAASALVDPLVPVFEFYDIAEGKMCVWAGMGGTEYLVEPRDTMFPGGHPFTRLDIHEVVGDTYPMGFIEPILSLNAELNDTRSQQLAHRRKHATKYLIRSGAFDDRAVAGFRSRTPGTTIPVLGNHPLNDVASVLHEPPMNPDLYAMSQQILDDVDRMTGLNEFARSGASQTRRTATEAAYQQDALVTRVAEVNDKVEQAAVDVSRKLLDYAARFTQGSVHVKDRNHPRGLRRVYPGAELRGSFDFDIELGSMAVRDDAAKRFEAVQMLSTFVPLLGVPLNQDGVTLDMAKVVAEVLRSMGHEDADEYLTAPPQQQQAGPGGPSPGGPGGGVAELGGPFQQSPQGPQQPQAVAPAAAGAV